MRLDDIPKSGPAPDILHGEADNLLPGLAVSLTVSVVGRLIAVVGRDEGQEFTRGVDDRLVAFPHLFRGFSPGNLVAEFAVGRRQFGGPFFQRLVQHAQPGVGFMETAVLSLKRRQCLHEEILDGLDMVLVFTQLRQQGD